MNVEGEEEEEMIDVHTHIGKEKGQMKQGDQVCHILLFLTGTWSCHVDASF